MAYIFGPVRSRRLGASLGIDLIPYKTCNLDCAYCECGVTTQKTNSRSPWVSIDEALAEITAWMDANRSEYPSLTLTFAGGGEPTLHSEFGQLARRLKELYPDVSLTLITNGLLFSDPEVRRDAAVFDLVMPSLDAATQSTFEKINRPPAGHTIEGLIEGLAAFRREYTGTIWLEIFIIPGINDLPEELALLRKAALRIAPDRVQLNSLDRAGADPSVRRATPESLLAIAQALAMSNVEIISRASSAS
jgi:wyosine [tRNA(Phe)-imidazoG37] synthetase (radical SAM superfamily)